MDLLGQLVTILAVLVGALSTHWANHRMEQTKLRQMLLTRWDEKKLETYGEYVTYVRASIHAAVLLYETTEGLRDEPRDVRDLRGNLTDLGVAQSSAFERVMLLAEDSVVAAAHEVQEAVAAVVWQARGVVDGTLEDWRKRNADAFAAINRFHQEARDDLGVSGNFAGEEHTARGLLLPGARTEAADES
ncbi:hypothetical protein ACIP9H_15005 [Streptomyces sp. NPDC088732]|uniref:hypothetical protein n=1 Tax=Streptomyces sp. NPDC088732 TaxID=3365879 RepID=UPI00380C8266